MLAINEMHQSEVIAALAETGHDDIARRMARCQHDRLHRHSGWPWRCRSSGCWSCRRTITSRWWQTFDGWLAGPSCSLATIPTEGDLIDSTRRMRRGLRDVRDRVARRDHRWRAVAMGGLVDEQRAMILIQHIDIDQDEVWAVIEQRWPEVMMMDAGSIEPSGRLAVEDSAELARHRRGIEPIRVVIFPMMSATAPSGCQEPLPVLF